MPGDPVSIDIQELSGSATSIQMNGSSDDRRDVDVTPEELARLAAEVVALIEHHREELRRATAELTALQRTVRTEIRDAVTELERLAGAELPVPAAEDTAAPAPRRRFLRRR